MSGTTSYLRDFLIRESSYWGVLILSSILLIAVVSLVIINYDGDNKLSKRTYQLVGLNEENNQSRTWNDAAELYFSLYKDVITGEIDHEKLKLAKQEVLQLMMQKAGAFTFVEEELPKYTPNLLLVSHITI